MELTIAERLTLLMVLPQEGDLTTIRIVSKLREDLSFTEDELADWSIVVDGAAVRWDSEIDASRAYDFGAKARETIVKTLEKLSTDGKLTAQHLTLCDKFGIE